MVVSTVTLGVSDFQRTGDRFAKLIFNEPISQLLAYSFLASEKILHAT